MSRFFVVAVFIALCFSACSPAPRAEVEVVRYDQVLFSQDTAQPEQILSIMEDTLPDATRAHLRLFMVPGFSPDTLMGLVVRSPYIRHLHDTALIVFPNLDEQERQFGEAFYRLQERLPHADIPKVYTAINEYIYAVQATDSLDIVVGLESFLGADFAYPSEIPYYQRQVMTPDHLVPTVLNAYLTRYVAEPAGNGMLDLMLYQGKLLYLLQELMPNTPDHVLWGYTEEQADFVRANELDMWRFFLDRELLYSTDYREIQKYVDRSPNSPGMPDGAPGRTANWIGMRIIQRYMQRNDVPLADMLLNNDAQALLDGARYAPR